MTEIFDPFLVAMKRMNFCILSQEWWSYSTALYYASSVAMASKAEDRLKTDGGKVELRLD